MHQSLDHMFDDAKESRKNSKYCRLEKHRDEERPILKSLSKSQRLPDQDDLGKNQRLDDAGSVVEVADARLGQDERAIKGRCQPMLGFKSYRTAAVTLAGLELVHRIRKRQFKFGPGWWSRWSLKKQWERALA